MLCPVSPSGSWKHLDSLLWPRDCHKQLSRYKEPYQSHLLDTSRRFSCHPFSVPRMSCSKFCLIGDVLQYDPAQVNCSIRLSSPSKPEMTFPSSSSCTSSCWHLVLQKWRTAVQGQGTPGFPSSRPQAQEIFLHCYSDRKSTVLATETCPDVSISRVDKRSKGVNLKCNLLIFFFCRKFEGSEDIAEW